jgi:hypothetical protein
MLNPEWDRVGIGYHDGLYVAEFGDGPDQPAGTPSPAPAPAPTPAPTATQPGSFGPSTAVLLSAPTGGTLADSVKVTVAVSSSGHRANILSDRYHDIGVGFENNYWVQDFGSGDLDPYTAIA